MNSNRNLNTVDLLDALAENLSTEQVILAGMKGSLAAMITTRRQKLGLSQKDLATKLHVTQRLVSRWERGETNFTLETLVKIAQTLSFETQCPLKAE